MRNLVLSLLASLALAPTVYAWGGVGHTYVAKLAIDSLPPSSLKQLLAQNAEWYATASSHPDRWRNRPENAEAPRHFLDGERFGFGTDLSKIPQDFAAVQKVRNYTQLRSDGMNPWTVNRIYKLLVIALKEKRWDDVLVQSAYLSHYVGDAHVPFHASENYDGQLSVPSQKGIHARFESVMLEKSIAYSELRPGAPVRITNPISDSFTTLQASINEVAPILAADKAAQAAAGDTQSDAYWSAFTTAAKPIAIKRLELGGRTLAGYLQSAWIEAGRPTAPKAYKASNTILPYAPPFVPRGEPFQPAMPVVSAEEKAKARVGAGTVIHIESKALGKFVPTTVVLPKGYWQSSQRYPVLYLLHGAFGKHTDWFLNSGLAAYVADLPLIVVLPDAQGDSFYQNSPRFGNYQTYFEQELMPEIDSTFRTIAARDSRAIAGLSMGGYGAWRLALDNPTKFCAAASLSGVVGWGVTPNPALTNFAKTLFPRDPEQNVAAGSVLARIEKLTGPKGEWRGPALWFDCGKDDFLIEGNRDMERRLLEKGLPFEFAEFEGAHTWPYWDEHLRDVLNFTLRHLKSPSR